MFQCEQIKYLVELARVSARWNIKLRERQTSYWSLELVIVFANIL